jgi:hypothetical protein
MSGLRFLFVGCVFTVALVAALAACSEDEGDSDRAKLAGSPSAAATINLDVWADKVCALAVEAADTLDAAGAANPGAMSLEERKQRAAEVLAPLAKSLGATADEFAALEPPEAAADFYEVMQTTMADVSSAWLDLVAAAGAAQSDADIDAANEAWTQAQEDADAAVVASYATLDAEAKEALSLPEDCGILNEVRS